MSCGKCAERIENAFKNAIFQSEVNIDVESKQVSVNSTVSSQEIFETIKHAGYNPVEEKEIK
jgi:copper chaperone CopZ